MDIDPRRDAAEALLIAHGAGRMAHPGGTLLAHSGRVREQLAAWGAPAEVQLAGLCHAAYGTEGFPVALLAPDQRPALTEVIGGEAEQLVHLYGSCCRRDAYRQLGAPVVEFRDRSTGARRSVGGAALRAFVEITAANELDVVRHDPVFAAEHGPALRRLFDRARRHLSAPALAAWDLHPDR